MTTIPQIRDAMIAKNPAGAGLFNLVCIAPSPGALLLKRSFGTPS